MKYLNTLLHRLFLLYKTGKSSGSIWDNSINQYKTDNKPIYWESITEVAKYQFKKITGDENINYLDFIIEKVKGLTQVGLKGLSIGCCEDHPTEQVFWETGMFSSFDIVDISDQLLTRQRKKFNNPNFSYKRIDLNTISLPENHYNLISAIGTIHHVQNLEHLFHAINLALSENGLFFLREYVGPNYLQFTNKQISLANIVLQCLPDSYKQTPEGKIKKKTRAPNKFKLKIIDPSEAVNSQGIIEAMMNNLHVLQFIPTGGTLLSPILDQIAFNFTGNEPGKRLLTAMIELERGLIQCGEIGSDYMFSLGSKKKT